MSLLNEISERKAINKVCMYIIVDSCGGMRGECIGALNTALEESITMFKEMAEQTNSEIYMKILSYSTGAQWYISRWTSLEDMVYEDIEASGVTDLGAALSLLDRDIQTIEEYVCPVILHFAYGLPTDDFEPILARLKTNSAYERALKYTANICGNFDEYIIRNMGSLGINSKDVGILKRQMIMDIKGYFEIGRITIEDVK